MIKRLLTVLRPLLILIIFGGAVWLLYHELRGLAYRQLVGELWNIPLRRILIAVGLTALNYVVLFGYDLLAVRYIGHPLPLRRLAIASFIGHVASFNFGAILGGSSIRYRFYSAWGYSTIEILQLITILGITFWLGAIGLAGVVFILAPLPMPRTAAAALNPGENAGASGLSDQAAAMVQGAAHLIWEYRHIVGIVLVAHVVAYLAICAIRRRPLRIFKWELPLPPPSLTIAQVTVACADLLIAAAVLYSLQPTGSGVSYPIVLGVFLLGMVVSVLTHIPGGAGVFELVLVLFLPQLSLARSMAWVLVYRGVYYLLPLVAASILLAVHEVVASRAYLRKVAGTLDAINPIVVPRILAFVVFVAGVFLLFSGATPVFDVSGPSPVFGGAIWRGHPLPLLVVEASHFATGLIGVTLLFLGLRAISAHAVGVLAGRLLVGRRQSLLVAERGPLLGSDRAGGHARGAFAVAAAFSPPRSGVSAAAFYGMAHGGRADLGLLDWAGVLRFQESTLFQRAVVQLRSEAGGRTILTDAHRRHRSGGHFCRDLLGTSHRAASAASES